MSEILTAGEWVRNHVIELATIDPDAPLDDLEPLREVIGDARVVALGEGAHFIEEFWTVRRRLTRFLCEHLGFRIVAAEFDLREGDDLQEWLANPADPRPLAEVSRAAADWGMAATAHWLRTWNATLEQPVRFVGIDAPNGGQAIAAMLRNVAEYVRAFDPDIVPLIECTEAIAAKLVGTSVAKTAQAWAALGTAQQNEFTAALNRLQQRMAAMEPLLVDRSDTARFQKTHRMVKALMCADYMLRASEAMYRGAGALLDHSVRDRFMADRVLELLEHEPDARVVLLAHNAHVQKQPVIWGDYLSAYPMGMYLHRSLGDAYCVIGTTTTDDHTSEMELDPSTEVGFRVVDTPLDPPENGSVEAALIAAGLGDRITFCPLDKAAGAGIQFDRVRSQAGCLTGDISAAYDGLLNLPRITVDKRLGF